MDSLSGIYLLGIGVSIATLFFIIFTLWGDITFGFLIWLFAAIFLGKEFFLISITGVPDIYMERLVFVVLLAVFIYEIWMGRGGILPNNTIDYLMLLMLGVLLVSMSLTGFLAARADELQPFTAFLSGFLYPFFFYYFGKTMINSEQRIRILLWSFFLLFIYLIITNYLEHFKINSLIFPKYITNPLIGIHYGRARGPFGLAPINGWFVASLFILTLFLRSRITNEGLRFLMLLFLFLSIPAIFYTYTRAVWLSFLLAPLVVFIFSKGMIFRARFLVFPLIFLLLYVFLNWQNITGAEREAGGVVQISEVQDRIALYEATKAIFKERPIFGVGFGRFGREANFYATGLGVRTNVAATSQHNLFFSLASEVGIIGLLPFILILFFSLRYSWLLYRQSVEEGIISRDLVVSFWAIMIVYIVNASFIQTQYFPSANAFIFLWIGTIVGLYQRKVLMQGPDQEPLPA